MPAAGLTREEQEHNEVYENSGRNAILWNAILPPYAGENWETAFMTERVVNSTGLSIE